MKYKTFWWGVKIIAENECDLDALKYIENEIADKEPECDYEGGGVLLEGNELELHRWSNKPDRYGTKAISF